jgi:flagellin
MRINNNISAMNTSRQLGNVSGRLSRSMEKLSSGLRIARAADDAAGLAVSEKLRGQIRGVNAAVRAQQDSVSGLQVAEGALNEVSSMLTRSKELLIQKDGTSDTTATAAINSELTQIFTEVKNIVEQTEYNGKEILNSATASDRTFKIYTDINGTTADLTLSDLSAQTVTGGETMVALTNAIDVQDATDAINLVATARGEIGSFQNRFEASIRNFEGTAENLQAAESRIRDVDMAKEMVGFTKDTIIQQAAQAMLVQANQLPQNIVGLLQ